MTIRVFVGCAPNHDDAESQAVLEYTLRKHTSAPIDITWMKLSRDPASPFYGWRTDDWATPFTGFRHAVPKLCSYEGRAIYCDSDVIFRADVAELWGLSLHGDVMQKNTSRNCVTLWNCSRVTPMSWETLKAGNRPSYTLEFFPPDKNWNCLDGEDYASLDDPRIKAIHYTSMPHQPHHARAAWRLAAVGRRHWFNGATKPHWRDDLRVMFDRLLDEAEAAGFTVESYCQDEPYGDFKKASNASLRGDVPYWGGRNAAR